MTNQIKGTIYVLLCVALWALIPVVAKLGQSHLDNHQFLFWSSLVSFIVIISYCYINNNIHLINKYSAKEWRWFIFLGLLGTYIYYLFLYLGYSQATGIEVLVIQYTWPIMIVIFSIFLLNESITLKKSIAALLGFFGVLLVLSKGQLTDIHINNPIVIMLVAAGASCFALFSVLSKKVTQEASGVVAIYFAVATFASFLSMLIFSNFAIPAIEELLAILLNGIFVNGFSYILWMQALKLTEASYLAPFTFITPVLSAVYLVVFFDATFYPAYGIGLCLVILGGCINTLTSKQ